MDNLAHLEILDQLEQLEQVVSMVRRVRLVSQVQVVQLEILDLKVHRDHKDHEVLLVVKVERVIPVLLVHQDLKASVAPWEPVDLWEILDQPVLQEELDGLDQEDTLDSLEVLVIPVRLEVLDLWDTMVRGELREHQEHRVLRDTQVIVRYR